MTGSLPVSSDRVYPLRTTSPQPLDRADPMTVNVSRAGRLRTLAARLAAAWKRSPSVRIVGFALGFRLFSSLLGLLSNVLFPLVGEEAFTVFGRTHLFWDSFARHDSGWYFGIARYGYEYVEGGRSNLAFFPLYPMLMRFLAIAMGGGRTKVYIAGIIISWVAFIIACVLLYRLARHFLEDEDAERTVIYAAAFPFAFFYGVVYSEALFFMLAVSAFLAFRNRRWVVGGLAGAALSATRVTGILALPALAWVAWQIAGQDRRERWRAAIGVALVPMGIGIYSAYVFTLSGSFLEWMHSITRWEYYPGGAPWTAMLAMIGALLANPYTYLTEVPDAPYHLLNVSAVLFALAMLPAVKRRMGWPYVLFIVMNLWLPLSSGSLEGLGRYTTVLFPLFIAIPTISSMLGRNFLLIVFASLFMVCRALFATLHPMY